MKITSIIYMLIVTVFSCLYCNSAIAMDKEEMMATFINMHGQLCAKVVNVNRLEMKNTFEVTCIEYRGGTGTVDYIVNLDGRGSVTKR